MRSALGALLILAAPALAMELSPIAVTSRVHYLQGKPGAASSENQGFNSNAGFVVTDEGVVVVDALGTVPLGEALVRAIRKVTDKPIRRVIVTHYHADHFYGLEPLKKAGAEVWAHRAARDYLEGGDGQRRLEQRSRDLFPGSSPRCGSSPRTAGSSATRASPWVASASTSTISARPTRPRT